MSERCEGCGRNEWLKYHDYLCPHCGHDNKKEKFNCVMCKKEVDLDNDDEFEFDWDGDVWCKGCFTQESDTGDLLG